MRPPPKQCRVSVSGLDSALSPCVEWGYPCVQPEDTRMYPHRIKLTLVDASLLSVFFVVVYNHNR